MNQQARALDSEIFTEAPTAFRREFFAEIPEQGELMDHPEVDDATSAFYVMRILVLLENAWLGLSLGRYWGHPMNDGWMNYFHRWAAAPTLRRWWPILCPLFSVDFRDFIKGRFDLRLRDPKARPSDAGMPGPTLELIADPSEAQIRSGHAWQMLEARGIAGKLLKEECFGRGNKSFTYRLDIAREKQAAPLALQVGLLFYRVLQERGNVAVWNTDEFFVPDPLSGAGTMGRFLDRVIEEFKARGFSEIRVSVNTHPGRDPVSRALRLRTVDFYKSRHFHWNQQVGDGKAALRLVL